MSRQTITHQNLRSPARPTAGPPTPQATPLDTPDAQPPAAGPAAEISPTVPDWSRERCALGQWDPSRRLLRAIRRYQYWKGRLGAVGYVLSRVNVLRHRFWSAVTGAEIPLNSRLGGGLAIPHPNGIVINPGATIGPNCLVLQQVTIGYGGARPGNPTIGGHVDIGAGAKVLGGITVGDHARIGANAVVLCDVPPGATAVGVPARVIAPPAPAAADRVHSAAHAGRPPQGGCSQ